VRVGKHIVIRLGEDDEAEAAAKVTEMCDKLLANPIIEEYTFELERVET
jgi:phosphoribosylformylglycinamidine synthase